MRFDLKLEKARNNPKQKKKQSKKNYDRLSSTVEEKHAQTFRYTVTQTNFHFLGSARNQDSNVQMYNMTVCSLSLI